MKWTGILKEVSRSAGDGPLSFCTVWDKFVPKGDWIYFRRWLTSSELSVHRNLSENPEIEDSVSFESSEQAYAYPTRCKKKQIIILSGTDRENLKTSMR
jgi:hypothetical protein